jgi:hypothetical protein
MEVIQVTQELMKVYERLNKAIAEINRLAKYKAEAERNYRMKLSMQYVKLKFEGVSVTLIPDMAKGNVAELMYERDSSEAQFTAVRESIAALQTQASVLQSVLKYQEQI